MASDWPDDKLLREVLGENDIQVECAQNWVDSWTFSKIAAAMRSIAAQARERAIEECAMAAWNNEPDGVIAELIRALSQPKAGE